MKTIEINPQTVKKSGLIAVAVGVFAVLAWLLHRAERRAEAYRVNSASLVEENGNLTAQLLNQATQLDTGKKIAKYARKEAQAATVSLGMANQQSRDRGLMAILASAAAVICAMIALLLALGFIPTQSLREARSEISYLKDEIHYMHERADLRNRPMIPIIWDCPSDARPKADPQLRTPNFEVQSAGFAGKVIDQTEASWPSLTGIELIQSREEGNGVGILSVGQSVLWFYENSIIVLETQAPPVKGEVYDVAGFSHVAGDRIGRVYLTQDPSLRLLPHQ